MYVVEVAFETFEDAYAFVALVNGDNAHSGIASDVKED